MILVLLASCSCHNYSLFLLMKRMLIGPIIFQVTENNSDKRFSIWICKSQQFSLLAPGYP